MGAELKFCLIVSNDFCWLSSQIQSFLLPSNSCIGFATLASYGQNLPSWFTIPINRPTSVTFLGGGISVIARIFVGSGWIPFWLTICPRNLIDACANWHLSAFNVTFAAFSLCSTFSKRCWCSAVSLP